LLIKKGNVLDVACGKGQDLYRFIKNKQKNIVMIDND